LGFAPQLKRDPLGCPSYYMPFWGFILLGIAASAILVWWGMRPVYYHHRTLANVPKLVDSFLSEMSTGAVWFAEREGGPGFLQLRLASNQLHEQVVEFWLPDVEWARGSFDSAMRTFTDSGFTPTLEAPASGQATRFLRVRCAEPRPRILETSLNLLAIAATGLGWEPSQTYTVHWEGIGHVPRGWLQLLGNVDRAPHNSMTQLYRRIARRLHSRHDG
jgi:hypothetical protein